MLPMDSESKVQLILDASKLSVQIPIPEGQLPEVEQWARRFAYALHAERARVISDLPSRKRYGL
jgi:hypothetical protein